MRLVQHRVQLVAQTVVQGEVGAQLEAILGKEPKAAGTEVAMRIADELQGAIGNPLREVNQCVGDVRWSARRIRWPRQVVGSTKRDLPAEREVIQAIQLKVSNIAAHLKRMASSGVREIVDPLIGVDRCAAGLVNAPT